jgi:predicted RNase H-like nuclease
MRCVGVDGCKAGWFAVERTRDGFAFAVHAGPRELIAAHAAARVIAVDVPIGLSDDGPRAPDADARRFVGRHRAPSIFSAPVRGVLGATTYAEALRLHRQLDREHRGLSAQAFGILPKIRAWDEALRSDADARARVFEIHPEVSFAALNGDVGLVEGKKTAHGRELRLALLGRVFDEAAVRTLLAGVARRVAAADDVLDAFAALWSAERIANGVARSLPPAPVLDANGWNVAIHY